MVTGMLVLALFVAACTSGDEEEQLLTIRGEAEQMIAGPVAEQAGLGELAGVCPEVAPAVGTTFECSATTADQRIVGLQGVINDQGLVELNTDNVITGPALPSFERAAVAALNNTVGSRLTDDAIDCGADSVVFGQDMVMICALLDPHTGGTYDVTLTVTDIEARQFSLVVADDPRS